MSETITKIVIADKHFLYLPLYYADYKNYFGLLPEGHKIQIVRSRLHTDTSAFAELIDVNAAQNRDTDIAVCDPAVILRHNDSNVHPVAIAGLITNSAFWAINHKAHTVSFLSDIASFDAIISFKRGTTSFGIANRIFSSPAKTAAIRQVDPESELTTLVESPRSTIALSPDILAIQNLLETRGDQFGIELSLAETEEYRDMLVTALLTRRDVLDKKPALVRALLQSVQMALASIRRNDPEIVAFAAREFTEDVHTVERALAQAHKAEVYPMNIKISRPAWIKLAETANLALQKDFDSEAKAQALRTYQLHVEPYSPWAVDAVRAVEDALLIKPPVPSKVKRLWQSMELTTGAVLPPLILGILMLVHAATLGALHWYWYFLPVGIALLAAGTARHLRITPWTITGILYWAPTAGLVFAVVALCDFATASQFVQDTFAIDLGTRYPKPALWSLVLTLTLSILRYSQQLLHRQKPPR